MFQFYCVFFFKQKTAYEMRISDWSSDVCSSDLHHGECGGCFGRWPARNGEDGAAGRARRATRPGPGGGLSMGYWLAKTEHQMKRGWIKRFDPRFWAVNFPRPMMESVVTTASDALRFDAVVYRADAPAGLIWEAEDRPAPPHLACRT